MEIKEKKTKRKYRKLHYEDRVMMQKSLENGETFKEIALKIGCTLVTVLKEYDRGRQKDGKYDALEAQKNLKM